MYVEGLWICMKIYIYSYKIYVLKQLYKKLHRHNLIVIYANKRKTVVITDSDMYQQKTNLLQRKPLFPPTTRPN
jgi:beta-lactamase regulating signal transducer with metallopeptidase domain